MINRLQYKPEDGLILAEVWLAKPGTLSPTENRVLRAFGEGGDYHILAKQQVVESYQGDVK